MISKIRFSLSLYSGIPERSKATIHKLIMSCARFAKGSYCFKQSVDEILRSIGWVRAEVMIKRAALCFIDRILKTNEPPNLYDLYRVNNRQASPIGLNFYPRTTKFKLQTPFNILDEYNRLPKGLKCISHQKFKSKLKECIN